MESRLLWQHTSNYAPTTKARKGQEKTNEEQIKKEPMMPAWHDKDKKQDAQAQALYAYFPLSEKSTTGNSNPDINTYYLAIPGLPYGEKEETIEWGMRSHITII